MYALLFEDLDVVLDMCGSSDLLGQSGKNDRSANSLQVALLAQFGADSDDIHRSVLVDELGHRLVDHLVPWVIETGRAELLKRHVDG